MNHKTWLNKRDFWKSGEDEWLPLWKTLKAAGFPDAAIAEILDAIVGLAAREYGD